MKNILRALFVFSLLYIHIGCSNAPLLKPLDLNRSQLVTTINIFGEPSKVATKDGATICKLSYLKGALIEAKVYLYFENIGKTGEYKLYVVLNERQTKSNLHQNGILLKEAVERDSQEKVFPLESGKEYALEVSLRFSSSIPLDWIGEYEYSLDLSSSGESIDRLVVNIPQMGGSISGLNLHNATDTIDKALSPAEIMPVDPPSDTNTLTPEQIRKKIEQLK
jgi:hypothetical protein